MSQQHRWKRNHRRNSRPYQNNPEAHRHGHSQDIGGSHGNGSNQGNQSYTSSQSSDRYHRHGHRRQHSMRWGDRKRTEQQYSMQNYDESWMRNQRNQNSDRRETSVSANKNQPPYQFASSSSRVPNQSGPSGSQSGTLPSTIQSGESSSTCNNNQPKVKHLPGFYYDPEKKKYFRLLPGHNNHNPITKDGLQLKVAEENRLQMMQGKQVGKSSHDKPRLKSKKHEVKSGLLLQLVRKQQHGSLQTRQFQRYAHEQCIHAMPVKPCHRLTPCSDSYFDENKGSIVFLKVDRQHRKVLMLIQDSCISKLWHGTVQWDNKSTQFDIHNSNEVCNIIHTPNNKVTNVEWASSNVSEDVRLLYTVAVDKISTAYVVRSYQASTSPDWKRELVYRAEVSSEMLWTCAWNHNTQLEPQFSLGGSKKAVVFRIEHLSRRELFSGNSDVVTQVYSLQQPLLYNGTRRGEILGCDLRTPCKRRADLASQLKHQMCMCGLQLLKDENYLLASDISGKVKLWDIRMCRCVCSYEGLINKHSQLPVSVDSSETIVYGAGIDKSTKLWSLQDGRLLHTIPSPLPLHTTGYPIPVYSQHWYGGNTPGLIVGMGRQLFGYNLSL